jgi:hypothetical protein
MSKTVGRLIAKNEFAWGAEDIAEEINRTPAQFYHVARTKPEDLSGLKKVAGQWCLHLPTFRASFKGGAA